MRLSDLLGQDAALTALRRALASGRVAHAYLFEGLPGVGKRGAALGLAMALACAAEPGAGCGRCDACRRIEAGLHPDAPTFAPSGPGGQIVVDDVKAIVALARMRPHEAAARVVVIDDADAMNPNAANGLLKTLEEPLPRNHVVLCTAAPDRLLPTIRSRTQRVRFRALTTDALLALARARDVPPARAEIAVALADGSAARMLAAAGEEDGGLAAALSALRAVIAAPGIGDVFDAAAALAGEKEKKQDLSRVLALLGRLHRDALAIAAGAPELAVMTGADDAAGGAGALAAAGVDRLNRALAAVVEAQLALAANVNPTLALERMLLALRRAEARAA